MLFHIFGRRWVWLRFFGSICIVLGCNFLAIVIHTYINCFDIFSDGGGCGDRHQLLFSSGAHFQGYTKLFLSIFVTIQRSISFIENWLLQIGHLCAFLCISRVFSCSQPNRHKFWIGFFVAPMQNTLQYIGLIVLLYFDLSNCLPSIPVQHAASNSKPSSNHIPTKKPWKKQFSNSKKPNTGLFEWFWIHFMVLEMQTPHIRSNSVLRMVVADKMHTHAFPIATLILIAKCFWACFDFHQKFSDGLFCLHDAFAAECFAVEIRFYDNKILLGD